MTSEAIDHDQLFKQLLETFFWEFIELFLPQVIAYLDPTVQIFLQQEFFTDIATGERRIIDLLVQVRFRGQDAYFLIHLEHQSYSQSDFEARMFHYFAYLHQQHNLPIYPIVLFSFDQPQRPEPDCFLVEFPDLKVLEFRYHTIQLNQLNWRHYLQQQNPVAAALMAKMKIAPADRPKVKAECLRLLATLRLDPARVQLISGFIDTYLRLNPTEEQVFVDEIDRMGLTERETTMQIVTSWMEKGIEQGIERGIQQGIERGIQQGIERGIQQGVQQGVRQGVQVERRTTVENILKVRFGDVDDLSKTIVPPLLKLSPEEYVQQLPLLLTLSSDELLARFKTQPGDESIA